MKRHPSLAPLSRDHHAALILAQLLKENAPAYKGLPTSVSGKAEYAAAFYKTHLIKHFVQEEKMLKKLGSKNEVLATLASEIFYEHERLTEMFTSIGSSDGQVKVLNQLGYELEAHIRKEERMLFPLLQQHCSEEELKSLASIFTEE